MFKRPSYRPPSSSPLPNLEEWVSGLSSHVTERQSCLMNAMDTQSHNTSLQRLQNVEKRIVRVLELAGSVMDELANPSGPRKELVNSHCSEFMQLIKDIQVTLREEIKSACEYRPFEKCDYVPRISNEICCKKIEYVLMKLDEMKQTIEGYQSSA